jgi:spore maturation protein SpmA
MAVLEGEKVEYYSQDRRDDSCKEIKLTRGAITMSVKMTGVLLWKGLVRVTVKSGLVY